MNILKYLFTLLIISSTSNLTAETPPVKQNETAKAVMGLDHIGLTVSNLEASSQFFETVLGFQVGGEDKSNPAKFLSNGHIFLTLWQTTSKETSIAFNRKTNVGLHHLALKVSSFEELDRLYNAIKNWEGAKVEFAPELSYGGPAKHMMIREPSGNRLELVHRPK